MTDKNRQNGNESVGEKSDGLLAGDAREALSTQKGPAKAWCRICEAVTPCSWRWNDDTCADLCCDACHNIHVCVHEFSDSDSQRLEALARAVMHDHIYHDTLAARIAELESRPAPEALPDYKKRFEQMVYMLGEITQALGISDDEAACANGNDVILSAIRELKVERDNFADDAYALAGAPEALGAAMWQPIETAPKNEDVLVYAAGRQYVAWFQNDETDPYREDGDPESDLNNLWCVTDNKHGPYALRGSPPTHWMYLPHDPTKEQA